MTPAPLPLRGSWCLAVVPPLRGRAGRSEGQWGQPVDWCLCGIGVTIRGSTACCRQPRLGQAGPGGPRWLWASVRSPSRRVHLVGFEGEGTWCLAGVQYSRWHTRNLPEAWAACSLLGGVAGRVSGFWCGFLPGFALSGSRVAPVSSCHFFPLRKAEST